MHFLFDFCNLHLLVFQESVLHENLDRLPYIVAVQIAAFQFQLDIYSVSIPMVLATRLNFFILITSLSFYYVLQSCERIPFSLRC